MQGQGVVVVEQIVVEGEVVEVDSTRLHAQAEILRHRHRVRIVADSKVALIERLETIAAGGGTKSDVRAAVVRLLDLTDVAVVGTRHTNGGGHAFGRDPGPLPAVLTTHIRS